MPLRQRYVAVNFVLRWKSIVCELQEREVTVELGLKILAAIAFCLVNCQWNEIGVVEEIELVELAEVGNVVPFGHAGNQV